MHILYYIIHIMETVWTQSDQRSKKWSRKSERLTVHRVRAYYYYYSLYNILYYRRELDKNAKGDA